MSEPGTTQRIVRAAHEIVAAAGADAVSMRKVASQVGITPMAIYRHFANRDDLLRAVADAAFAELGKDWAQRARSGGFEQRLTALLHGFLDFALGQPQLYGLLMTERWDRARRFPQDFRDGGSPAFSRVVELVEEGVRAGWLRRDEPLEVALTITSQTQGLVQLHLAGRTGLSEPEFRTLCERSMWRVLRGVVADEEGAGAHD